MDSIDYYYYNSQENPVQFSSDDIFSGIKLLPFSFPYYGMENDSIAIGTNGRITFDTSKANQYSNWRINNGFTLLGDSNTLANTIYGCYHNMYNHSAHGGTYTSIIGEAPLENM